MMNKLIVVPARGGSKGIPRKNIYPLLGKPLLEYTIEVILRADLESTDIVVSTDSEEIKAVALKFEGVYVVDRPIELSGDKASTEDALLHAVMVMEQREQKKYDAVITMQPTSPLRSPNTLKVFVKEYENKSGIYDAMLSLSESRSDYWVCREGNFSRLNPDAPRRRQERTPLYVENSAYYITDIKSLRETHSVLGKFPTGFVISEIEGIDINEETDLRIAEFFLKQKALDRGIYE